MAKQDVWPSGGGGGVLYLPPLPADDQSLPGWKTTLLHDLSSDLVIRLYFYRGWWDDEAALICTYTVASSHHMYGGTSPDLFWPCLLKYTGIQRYLDGLVF